MIFIMYKLYKGIHASNLKVYLSVVESDLSANQIICVTSSKKKLCADAHGGELPFIPIRHEF